MAAQDGVRSESRAAEREVLLRLRAERRLVEFELVRRRVFLGLTVSSAVLSSVLFLLGEHYGALATAVAALGSGVSGRPRDG